MASSSTGVKVSTVLSLHNVLTIGGESSTPDKAILVNVTQYFATKNLVTGTEMLTVTAVLLTWLVVRGCDGTVMGTGEDKWRRLIQCYDSTSTVAADEIGE